MAQGARNEQSRKKTRGPAARASEPSLRHQPHADLSSQLQHAVEKTLDQQKLEADIGKLMAETMKLHEEGARYRAEDAELQAKGSKLRTETAKFRREAFWYPFMAAATVITAGIAVGKFILR